MLSTDTNLELLLGLTATLNPHFNELPNPRLVQTRKRIGAHHLSILVIRQEGAGIIPAETETGLGQVVRSKAEEGSMLRHIGGGKRSAGNFDHGPHLVFQLTGLETAFLAYLGGGLVDHRLLKFEFLFVTHQRNHDFGQNLDSPGLHLGGCFKNRSGLHSRNLRVDNPETATTVPEHRVFLMESLDATLDRCGGDLDLFGKSLDLGRRHGADELMKRRIEEANGSGTSLESTEDSHEVLFLVGEEFPEGLGATCIIFCQNHLAHCIDAIALEKHVFGPGEANPFRPKLDRVLNLARGIGIRTHTQFSESVGPAHELLEFLVSRTTLGRGLVLQKPLNDLRRRGFQLSGINITHKSIEREVVTLLQGHPVSAECLSDIVNIHVMGTTDADLAHLAGHQSGV